MVEDPIMIGRVLRASTTSYQLGCNRLIAEQDEFIPEFGALVKAFGARHDPIYGLIYDVSIEDDGFVRQLVAGGLNNPEMIEDQRRNRLALITVSVLVTGYGRDNQVYHRLPPQPPGTLDQIYACNHAETVRFTARHDWLRTVLARPTRPWNNWCPRPYAGGRGPPDIRRS